MVNMVSKAFHSYNEAANVKDHNYFIHDYYQVIYGSFNYMFVEDDNVCDLFENINGNVAIKVAFNINLEEDI